METTWATASTYLRRDLSAPCPLGCRDDDFYLFGVVWVAWARHLFFILHVIIEKNRNLFDILLWEVIKTFWQSLITLFQLVSKYSEIYTRPLGKSFLHFSRTLLDKLFLHTCRIEFRQVAALDWRFLNSSFLFMIWLEHTSEIWWTETSFLNKFCGQ